MKKAVAFFDGQNLFYAVKTAFGYSYPNYDPIALAKMVSKANNWELSEIYFYTGIPSIEDAPFWHNFWSRKLAFLGSRGVRCYSRHLKYRNQTVQLPNGNSTTVLVGQEKGIDIRLALDVVRMARANEFDVAVIFSQDQDLSEVADEVRSIAKDQGRWIKVASAFPSSPTMANTRGINKTDWLRFSRAEYEQCIDPTDYRGAKP
ncbi:MAG: NYN domain protein [bacterium ADurb.Bin374]|nr:MAG: NYN domain protein [bacterium ADurb.Bin374]